MGSSSQGTFFLGQKYHARMCWQAHRLRLIDIGDEPIIFFYGIAWIVRAPHLRAGETYQREQPERR
jgi:hypothetical protein